MKKKRAVAGGLLLVLGIAQSVSAGTTTVTYHVDPSYMVLVPANTTIPFNEESVNYGKIRIEEAQIEEGKCIQVELISDKKLKNQSGKEGEIPYEILADTTAFTKARYTTAGEETVLGITIDRESWKKAPSGSSMVVPKEIMVGQIEHMIAQRGGKILEHFELFDIYEGDQIERGFKSVAYSLTFRSKEKTLEEAEINGAMNKILNGLEGMGIQLRK